MHDKKIICLAVDDEPPALEVLKKYITSVPNLQLAGTCADALEALTMLQQHTIDLAFMGCRKHLVAKVEIAGTNYNTK
jgi:response regulator of citrate/malate metabolism